MTKHAEISVSYRNTSLNHGQNDPDCDFSSTDPEEGYRLIRIFAGIKRPALREAIIKFAMESSRLDDEKQ